jgi:hypothetical protein
LQSAPELIALPLCGSAERIQALPPEALEALAVGEAFSAGVALLDCSGPSDPAA